MGYDGVFDVHDIVDKCRSVDYWLEDQTIYALLLAPLSAEALDPSGYLVYTGGQIDAAVTKMIHFISSNRFTALRYPRLARRIYEQLKSV